MTALFVYGTLKRGCKSHHLLSRHRFLGEARTLPGYRLHQLDGYPGLVRFSGGAETIIGEVWLVDDAGLKELDAFEGLDAGLYRRDPVVLQPPFADLPAQAYFYARSIANCPLLGETWIE